MADMMADMEEVNEVMGRNYNVECDENELLGGGFRKKGLLFVSRFGERKGNNTTSLFISR